jgi:7-cyano-7-deazaguanine synthase
MRFVTEYMKVMLLSMASSAFGLGPWALEEHSMLRTAVLLSAGLDSAVLAASEARTSQVHPIYVSTGLAWENEELAALDRLLASAPFRGLEAPARLAFTVRDLYSPTHWALRGEPPAFDTPDEDVYLTGRNVILLSKAGIYCAQHRIGRLALGPLAGNPFPDATPEFFAAMARALSLGLAHDLEVATPLSSMHKSDVIRLGVGLGVPLELTLSCMNPKDGAHCGQCSKCRERRDAFHEAGVPDPTSYATVPVR